jgi:YVTN family beta-propeller protein
MTGSARADEYVLVGDQDNDRVIVVDPDTLTQTLVSVGAPPCGIAADPDGRWVYVTKPLTQTVAVIDAVTMQMAYDVPVGPRPCGVAVNAAGEAWVGDVGTGEIFIIKQGSVLDQISASNSISALAFSPDGSIAYVVDRLDDKLIAFDVASRSELDWEASAFSPIDIVVDPNRGDIYHSGTLLGPSAELYRHAFNPGQGFMRLAQASLGDSSALAFHPGVGGPAKLYAVITHQYTDVFDPSSLSPLSTITPRAAGDVPVDLATSPNRGVVYLLNTTSSTLEQIDVRTDTFTAPPIPIPSETVGVVAVLNQQRARLMASPAPLIIPLRQYNQWSPPVPLTIENVSRDPLLTVYQVYEQFFYGHPASLDINASACTQAAVQPQSTCTVYVRCQAAAPPQGTPPAPHLSFLSIHSDAVNNYETIKVNCVPG